MTDDIREVAAATTFTLADQETAYQDGIEDLADKILELIYQSDFEISLEEIVQFCEAEKGAPS